MIQIIGLILCGIFFLIVIYNATKRGCPPSEADIKKLANRYWTIAGKPTGRDQEFWFRAKADLLETSCMVFRSKQHSCDQTESLLNL